MMDKVSWRVWLHIYCPNESRNLWDCECSLGEIYETNRDDVYFIHILGRNNPDHCAILPADADDLN